MIGIVILGVVAAGSAACGSDASPHTPVVATPGDLLAEPPTPVATGPDPSATGTELDEAARAVFARDEGLVRRRFDVGVGGYRIDTVIDIAWVDGVGRITSRLDYDPRLRENPESVEFLDEMETKMVDEVARGDQLAVELDRAVDAMSALWAGVEVRDDGSGRWTTDVAAPATAGRLDVVVVDGMVTEAERRLDGSGSDVTSGDRWDVLE